jgi:hypothetical protein
MASFDGYEFVVLVCLERKLVAGQKHPLLSRNCKDRGSECCNNAERDFHGVNLTIVRGPIEPFTGNRTYQDLALAISGWCTITVNERRSFQFGETVVSDESEESGHFYFDVDWGRFPLCSDRQTDVSCKRSYLSLHYFLGVFVSTDGSVSGMVFAGDASDRGQGKSKPRQGRKMVGLNQLTRAV